MLHRKLLLFRSPPSGAHPGRDGDAAGLAGTALEVDCGHARGKATSHTVEAAALPMFLAQCSF